MTISPHILKLKIAKQYKEAHGTSLAVRWEPEGDEEDGRVYDDLSPDGLTYMRAVRVRVVEFDGDVPKAVASAEIRVVNMATLCGDVGWSESDVADEADGWCRPFGAFMRYHAKVVKDSEDEASCADRVIYIDRLDVDKSHRGRNLARLLLASLAAEYSGTYTVLGGVAFACESGGKQEADAQEKLESLYEGESFQVTTFEGERIFSHCGAFHYKSKLAKEEDAA